MLCFIVQPGEFWQSPTPPLFFNWRDGRELPPAAAMCSCDSSQMEDTVREIQRESTEQCLAEKKLQYKTKAGNHLFCQLCLPFLHTCSIFYILCLHFYSYKQPADANFVSPFYILAPFSTLSPFLFLQTTSRSQFWLPLYLNL